MDSHITIPHSWHLVNQTFIIGIKPDIAVHKNIMIGLLLFIPPFTITFNLCMIYLFLFSTKRHKYPNIFYKLVLAMCFPTIYWSLYFFYQGFCQLLGYSLFGETGNVIVASVAQYLFYVCMNMNLLLAFNRFSAVVLRFSYTKIFNPMRSCLFLLGIYGGSAILNIPGFMFLTKYYPELGTFDYLNKPSRTFLVTSIYIEMGIVFSVHAIIIVLYVSSFITYKRMEGMTNQNKRERRLFIQAIISGSPCFVLMTFHHLIHFPLLEVLAGELCVGIDPIVYMIFNKSIRADLFEIIGIKTISERLGSLLKIAGPRHRNTTVAPIYSLSHPKTTTSDAM